MKTLQWMLNFMIGVLLVILSLLVVERVVARPANPTPQTVLEPAALNGAEPQVQTEGVLYTGSAPVPEYDELQPNYASGIPRKMSAETMIPARPRVEVTTYVVQQGDNLFAIADKYGLKPETILWGNYDTLRDNPQSLRPGQELNILPTDGVYYQWSSGDTITGIAGFFRVNPTNILEYSGNRLTLEEEDEATAASIEPGTWLIIPEGRRELRDWGPPAITRSNPASARYYGAGACSAVYSGAIGTGTFIWPTTARYLSGYDYSPSLHPAIDIAGAVGNPIYAVDSGVVVYAGWSEYGYGYLIVLDHGNGWQSAYAHLSAVGVGCGQSVAQGAGIGGLGSSGNSTGPHLHFEMRSEIYGKVNPWLYLTP